MFCCLLQEYSTTISENLRDGTPLPGLNILVTDADVVRIVVADVIVEGHDPPFVSQSWYGQCLICRVVGVASND